MHLIKSLSLSWRRVSVLLVVAIALALAVLAAGRWAAADHLPYGEGDIFAAVGAGQIKHFDPAGNLIEVLDTTSGSTEQAGMCFDAADNLYSTNFTANNMSKFDNQGGLLIHPWGGPFNAQPESCVVDAAGNIYVGQPDGTSDILKFDSDGNLLASYDVAVGPRGSDWIDLAADQCTMFYTSEGSVVGRYDVCADAQLADFATGLSSPCFALRIRRNGEVLVTCSTQTVRLNPDGSVNMTYPISGEFLFAMNLDPDGAHFWTGGISSGNVYKVNIATGAGTGAPVFNAGILGPSLAGLAIFGEPVVALPQPYGEGDVFAAVGAGQIKHFDPAGNLIQVLDTTSGSTAQTTGMCFDAADNLYSTNFGTGTMSKFDNQGGLLVHPWGGPFSLFPESCVVDAAGNVYTGEVEGDNLIRKFDADGNLLMTFSPDTENRGLDWIDLAADQCTMFYTSEGSVVGRYDVCADAQLADFATGLSSPCFALRIRRNGEVLVTCSTQTVRLNPDGSVNMTYPISGEFLFAMNLDPDGAHFWTGGISSGNVYKVNIATGAGTGAPVFNAGILGPNLGGLAIFGEPVVAIPTPTPTSTPTPTPTPTPTITLTPTSTLTPTPTPTSRIRPPTPGPTPTPTPTPNPTPTPTATSGPTPTPPDGRGPSAFCHVTDGSFTDCDPATAGAEEWSDITPTFFPETESYLYAGQADLDPTLAGPESPMDTFMLMYDECGLTEPLGPDQYFLVYFNTIEEEDGVHVFENYVIHLFTDGTLIFFENGVAEEDDQGEIRVEEIAGQRGDVGFGTSSNCAFDHVIAEFEIKLSITGFEVDGGLSPGFNQWLSLSPVAPPSQPQPPGCQEHDDQIRVPLVINVLKKVVISDEEIKDIVTRANEILDQGNICLSFNAANVMKESNAGGEFGNLIQENADHEVYKEWCTEELLSTELITKDTGVKVFIANDLGGHTPESFFGSLGFAYHVSRWVDLIPFHSPPVTSCLVIQRPCNNTDERCAGHPGDNWTTDEMGGFLAHELVHVCTVIGHDEDPGDEDHLMAPKLLPDRPQGTELTEDQIIEIRKGCKKRAERSEHGGFADEIGDVSLSRIDLLAGSLFAEDLASGLEITITIAGLHSESEEVNSTFEMFFNVDGDETTGGSFGSFVGVDKVLELSLAGAFPFQEPGGSVTANLLDVASGTTTPLPEGAADRIVTIGVSSNIEFADIVGQLVSLPLLELSAHEVPIGVRATDLDTGEFDEAAFVFEVEGIAPIGIVNHDFETCSLHGWDVAPGSVASAITSLGPDGTFTPILPAEGQCMAFLSTAGSAPTLPGTVGSVISQTFVVHPGASTLDFCYQYVTNDSFPFEDFFLAELETGLGTFTLGSADNATGSPAGGFLAPPPPAISSGVTLTPAQAPILPSGVNILGSELFSSPSSFTHDRVCSSFAFPPELAGTTVTLRFTAGDSFDTVFASAVVIDAVQAPVELDFDFDGVPDDADGCLVDFNPDQQDSSFNGIGDACETAGELYTTAAFLNATIGGSTISEEISLVIGDEPSFEDRLARIVEYHLTNGLIDSASAFTQGIVDSLVEIGQVAEEDAEQLVADVLLLVDQDSDGVPDGQDACPTTPGLAQRQGCPVGDENIVELHLVDQAKTGACADGAGSCKSPIEGAEVRVFDRNDSDFQAEYGRKNPSGSIYDQVFENDIGRVGACTTDAAGECTAGEESTGDYLVIVKYVDAETGKSVYTGKPKSPRDFVDTDGDTQGDLATKDFQVIKVLRRNGSIQFSGGSKTVVSGSYLEVISPDFAVWEDVAAGYVYTFIFISDSDWDVDLCTRVPRGYSIVGTYDENGDLMSDSRCTQTFVSGETKVIAYEVVDVGSPEPRLYARLTVTHRGRVTPLTLDVPGIRIAEEHAPRGPLAFGVAGVTLVPLAMGLGYLGVTRRKRQS